MPFAISDGTCAFCREGLPTACVHVGFIGNNGINGAQAEAVVRASIDDLLPDILEGRIEPGKVFDRNVGLDGVPDGYRAMADRESRKVMVTPMKGAGG